MPTVTLSLVTFNGKKYLPFCLESILSQTYSDVILVVIDNGSIDGSAELIEREYLPKFGSRMRLVKNKENLGFARAHNQAILWSNSTYVACVNQDMVLDERFLEESVRALEAHPAAGAVAPKLLRWAYDEHGLSPACKTNMIDTMGLQLFRSLRVTDIGAGETDRGQYDALGAVFGPSGALPVYRRAALDDVRYGDEFFDDDFHSYKEDVDLAFRLRWRGWSTLSVPAALAWHDRTATAWQQQFSRSTFRERRTKSSFVNYFSYRNHICTLVKNIPATMGIRLSPFMLWFEFQKFCYALVMEWRTLSSWHDIVRLFPAMARKRKFILSRRKAPEVEIRTWIQSR